MKKYLTLGLGFLAIFALTSCANNSDPMKSFTDPTQTPALSLPVATTYIVTQAPFTTSRTGIYWTFSLITGQTALAPAEGTVTDTDGSTTVTILHSPRISTVLTYMTTVSVRVGDHVVTGQSLGTATAQLQMQVSLDGTAVCPLSYLSTDARSFVSARALATGQYVCQ